MKAQMLDRSLKNLERMKFTHYFLLVMIFLFVHFDTALGKDNERVIPQTNDLSCWTWLIIDPNGLGKYEGTFELEKDNPLPRDLMLDVFQLKLDKRLKVLKNENAIKGQLHGFTADDQDTPLEGRFEIRDALISDVVQPEKTRKHQHASLWMVNQKNGVYVFIKRKTNCN
jgi:hypothetical protein